MKKMVSLIMVLTMVCGICACSKQESAAPVPADVGGSENQTTQEQVESQPYKGTSINVITCNNAATRMAVEYLNEFEEATGIKVNIEIYEPTDAIQKVAVNAAANGTGIDVFGYRPIQESLSYEENGWFAPLDDYIAEAEKDGYDYDDFFASARAATTGKDGKIYGIPYLVEGEIIFVNTEMFAKLGLEQYPETLDELLAYCEKAYNPAENQYGIALRGEGNQAVTQFSGFLYAHGGDFIDYDTMTATMNTPEALEALEYYAELLKFGPEGITSANLSDSQNYYKQGLTLFRIDAYSQNPITVDPEQSLVWDKTDYAMFPSGKNGVTPYNITAWAWAISSTSKNQGAAWEFIRWVSGKEQDIRAALDGGFGARTSTWADTDVMQNIPENLAAVVQQTGEVGYDLDRPLCFNAAEVRALVGEMIDAANSGMRGEELKTFVETKNAEMQAILDTEK